MIKRLSQKGSLFYHYGIDRTRHFLLITGLLYDHPSKYLSTSEELSSGSCKVKPSNHWFLYQNHANHHNHLYACNRKEYWMPLQILYLWGLSVQNTSPKFVWLTYEILPQCHNEGIMLWLHRMLHSIVCLHLNLCCLSERENQHPDRFPWHV